ncbi:seipin-2-like [Mangifera indica]|uniref:seipin-2-like n=1 Tax=Mangifera indica TaxID=29780 RepID=UPI001CFB6C02|nr:seipin-2-like [Mangifera indica]
MDSPNPTSDDGDELFFDALDDFAFYDCLHTDQSDQSPSESKDFPSSIRRRSLSRRRSQIHRNLKESEIIFEKGSDSSVDRVDSSRVSDEKTDESTVTFENDDPVGDSVDSADSESSSLLVYMAGLMIKAIWFQFNLLIIFLLFPISILSSLYMLVIDPFGTIKRGREYLMLKFYDLWNLISGFVRPSIHDRLKGHESIWKLVWRFGWGLFWSIYVCFMLCGLLLLAVVISGFFMRFLVEKPIQIKETLNFDYTKNSPVAIVSILSCPGVFCGFNCEEKKEALKSLGSRVIPVGHKLQVTVMLKLPESDYNQKLGMFQVRVELLSANGKSLASSSHPCLLKFKSEPVRLLLTFLKVAPIVAGYVSESQTLNVKLTGFIEGDIPTSCVKVQIEHRAEYAPGAGIPELYDASLILESELPFFKRIIWYWKKTIFVWITITLFMTELCFTLICCIPIILPRPRPRGGSASNSAHRSRIQSQT